MQIQGGREKLSDTKVGEFDPFPSFSQLCSKHPPPPPSIIGDSMIKSIATWKPQKSKPISFLFSCCCQEMNKRLSMFCGEGGGQSPISWPGFPSWCYFLRYKAGNEISLCAVSPLARRLIGSTFFFFIRTSFTENMKPPLHLQTENLSQAITCHPHGGWYTPQ